MVRAGNANRLDEGGSMLRAAMMAVGLALVLAVSVPLGSGVSLVAAPGVQTRTGQVAQCPPAPKSSFGTKDKTLVSMEGKIYFIPENSDALPDFAALKSEGSIWTSEWNVPPRDFEEGFPGVTSRFEWFALDYQGSIYVSKAGPYHFRLGSDDGSKLYLDGTLVVDGDGVHGWSQQEGDATLAQGDHQFRLSFFQGPRTELGLQLFVTPPGGEEKIFKLQDFSRVVAENRKQLGVEESEKEIHVKLGSEVLFDTGKFDIKSEAAAALKQLADLLGSYPGYPIVIEGHTDNVGSKAINEKIGMERAEAVKRYLYEQHMIPLHKMNVISYGSEKPVAPNKTKAGRAQNRRVVIKVLA
jgi:outer membrane protein OmpA-like peptidoglycan-associated protein